eukprot:TRINITY_DN1812_c0_g4_i3.p1 TRINITY_DN1812_c0_g4~~TRINITY_DN1812_c0_g4_i3.p1  ORF type:complete len:321 (-),score=42.74 TRINITY_DN1812_c0_g4_i3:125-1087(-)
MSDSNTHWWALPYLLVLLSSFLSAFVGLGVKLLKEMDVFNLMYIRSVIMVTMNYFYIKWNNGKIYPPITNKKACRLIEIRCALGFTCATCFFIGVQNIPLSIANVLLQTVPIWTGILGKIFLKEDFGQREIISCAVSFLGVLFITKPPIPFFTEGQNVTEFLSSFPFYFICLINAILWAIALLIARNLRNHVDSHALNHQFAATMLIFSPIFISPSNLQIPTRTQLFFIIINAVITLLCWFLINEALKYEQASKIMPLNYCSLVFTGIFDKIIFNYFPSLSSLIGVILIAGSCIFLVVGKRKEEEKKPSKVKRLSEANIS